MKTKMVLLMIGIAVVASSIYAFICYHFEKNAISAEERLLINRNIVNKFKSSLLYGIEQHDSDFAEISDNLNNTLWNTSAYGRQVITTTKSGYTVHIPCISVPGIDCAALFNGSIHEIAKAHMNQVKWPKRTVSDDVYMNAAADCTQYITQRRFIMQPLSSEEADFPLAFSIVMFCDVELFERLLRAVYRPQNMYCVHVDKKSASTVHHAVTAITSCFSNVFIAQRTVSVYWGTYSVLEPELICMEALLSYSRKWRYFINLTGQEFPLKSNWDIVKILKVFRGANNIEGTLKRLLACIFIRLPGTIVQEGFMFYCSFLFILLFFNVRFLRSLG